MVIKYDHLSPTQLKADSLLVPVRPGLKELSNLPPKMTVHLKRAFRQRDFKGTWGQAEVIPSPPPSKTRFIAAIGLGQKQTREREAEAMRRAIAAAARAVARLGLKTMILDLRYEDQPASLAAAAVTGLDLSNYHFTEHSSQLARKHRRQQISRLIITCRPDFIPQVKKEVVHTKNILSGVSLTRDLVNQPAGHMSPRQLVKKAQEIASASAVISARILNRQQAAKENFNAFLTVARGSAAQPYVIHLKYKPKTDNPDRKQVWLVGKGVTFDSGGLSLKPNDGMITMKGDMAGGATVLGVFSVLDKVMPDIEIHGVIAACENMPSGNAYRPGDIVTAKNGQTIEILNTDAEGRITLADALTYAAESKPDAIIDIATLTGACMVALGETVAGLWSTDQTLSSCLLKAANFTGERLETMPMPEEYVPKLDSQVADITNVANSRLGGAITAALFLKEFTNGCPWAHIDIAGPAFMDKEHVAYWGIGATGFGVRTLVQFINSFASTTY